MKPRSPVKRVNAARKRREFARAYGSPARVKWVQGLPCVACGVVGYSENAHIETGGTSRKADAEKVVPLCGTRFQVVGCHKLLDRVLGRERFEAQYNLDLAHEAETTETRWRWEGGT